MTTPDTKTWKDYRKELLERSDWYATPNREPFRKGVHHVFRWLMKEFTQPKHKPPKPEMKFVINHWTKYNEYTLDMTVSPDLKVNLIKGVHKTKEIVTELGDAIADAYGHKAVYEKRSI